jgi:transposase
MEFDAVNDGQVIVEVGALPLFAAYLFSIGLIETINNLLPDLCYNYDRLDHGTTTFVLALYMFAEKNHTIYKIEDWVREERFLKFLFPEIEPHHFTEGKISRTLDLLGEIGIDSLMFGLVSNILKNYKDIKATLFHLDTTNFSLSGAYERRPEDDKKDGPQTESKAFSCSKKKRGSRVKDKKNPYSELLGEIFPDDDPIHMKEVATYACHPKDHDRAHKHIGLECAVMDDGSIPAYASVIPANVADVSRYHFMFKYAQKVAGRDDIMVSGDSKMGSNENCSRIHDGQGFYVVTAYQMNEKEKEALKKEVFSRDVNDYEVFLIRFDNREEDAEGNKVLKKRKMQDPTPDRESGNAEDKSQKSQRKIDPLPEKILKLLSKYAPLGVNEKPPAIYSGFECEPATYEWEGKTYTRRRIIVHSTRLAHEEMKALENKMAKSVVAIEKVVKKANNKKYADEKLLFEAVEKAVSSKSTFQLLNLKSKNCEETTTKASKRGPRSPKSVLVEEKKTWVELEWSWDQSLIDEIKRVAGHYPVHTNNFTLSTMQVVRTLKREVKVERAFRQMKSMFEAVPVGLRKDTSIRGIFFVLTVDVQVCAIIERIAQKHLEKMGGMKLVGLHPDQRAVGNPSAKSMFDKLKKLKLSVVKAQGQYRIDLLDFDYLQKAIFTVTETPDELYMPEKLLARVLSKGNDVLDKAMLDWIRSSKGIKADSDVQNNPCFIKDDGYERY